jgi:hypothetical protein
MSGKKCTALVAAAVIMLYVLIAGMLLSTKERQARYEAYVACMRKHPIDPSLCGP